MDMVKHEKLPESRMQSISEDEGTTMSLSTGEKDTSSRSVNAFLEEVASGSPAPGGGSASALAGALAAALAAMVGRLTIGKKKYIAVEDQMKSIVEAADLVRQQLVAAVDEDSAAFMAVMSAHKLEKDNPARDEAIESALVTAAETPLKVMKLSMEGMKVAQIVGEQGNTNAVTDAAVAAHLAWAAIEGAALNVRINTSGLKDRQRATQFNTTVSAIVEEARQLIEQIKAAIEVRAGLG